MTTGNVITGWRLLGFLAGRTPNFGLFDGIRRAPGPSARRTRPVPCECSLIPLVSALPAHRRGKRGQVRKILKSLYHPKMFFAHLSTLLDVILIETNKINQTIHLHRIVATGAQCLEQISPSVLFGDSVNSVWGGRQFYFSVKSDLTRTAPLFSVPVVQEQFLTGSYTSIVQEFSPSKTATRFKAVRIVGDKLCRPVNLITQSYFHIALTALKTASLCAAICESSPSIMKEAPRTSL